MNNVVGTIVIFILGGCLMAGAIGYSAGYRHGQIDYANGKIVYCLEKQADNSTIWRSVK